MTVSDALIQRLPRERDMQRAVALLRQHGSRDQRAALNALIAAGWTPPSDLARIVNEARQEGQAASQIPIEAEGNMPVYPAGEEPTGSAVKRYEISAPGSCRVEIIRATSEAAALTAYHAARPGASKNLIAQLSPRQ